MTWQLQDAKNRLSELVGLALSEGPQTITRHGKPTVVVLSYQEYQQVDQREKLADILRECPVRGWEVTRQREAIRSITLG